MVNGRCLLTCLAYGAACWEKLTCAAVKGVQVYSFLYTLGRSLDNNKMPLEGPIPSDLNGNRNGGKEIVDRWVWFRVPIGFF